MMSASDICIAMALVLNALVLFWIQKEFMIIRSLLERLNSEKEERKEKR